MNCCCDSLIEDSPTLGPPSGHWPVKRGLHRRGGVRRCHLGGCTCQRDWEEYRSYLLTQEKQARAYGASCDAWTPRPNGAGSAPTDPRRGDALISTTFLGLMRMSRADKEEYMTPERERILPLDGMADGGAGPPIRLFFMDIRRRRGRRRACAFDYGSSRLLYNSGYDPELSYYSVGLLAARDVREGCD